MKPLVDQLYLLERFQGKGGWTYIKIPEITQDKKSRFGWRKVRGFIDDYEIRKYHLMPMGKGQLFLPVKGEIRKKIKKKEGDWVRVQLFPDTEPLEIPEELNLCLKEDAEALSFFNKLSESEQKYYINWIYSAKREGTKIDRMAKTMNRLVKGLKMYDKE